jgi:hypothetical protein
MKVWELIDLLRPYEGLDVEVGSTDDSIPVGLIVDDLSIFPKAGTVIILGDPDAEYEDLED